MWQRNKIKLTTVTALSLYILFFGRKLRLNWWAGSTDRIFDRADHKEMVVLDCMTKFNEEKRRLNWNKHLRTVFELGQRINGDKL
jgi:hypothetical protein